MQYNKCNINADFCRNTKHVWRIETYFNDTKLVKAWDSFQIDFTHVFEKDKTTFTCNIDDFFERKIKQLLKVNDIVPTSINGTKDNKKDILPMFTRAIKC